MSVIFITHDMGVVAEIADRVVVMWRAARSSRIRVAASAGEPRQPYTRALLAAVPRLGSMRGERGAEAFSRTGRGRGCAAHGAAAHRRRRSRPLVP